MRRRKWGGITGRYCSGHHKKDQHQKNDVNQGDHIAVIGNGLRRQRKAARRVIEHGHRHPLKPYPRLTVEHLGPPKMTAH